MMVSVSDDLDISAETLLAQAGILDSDTASEPSTERAVRSDARLTTEQRKALIAV